MTEIHNFSITPLTCHAFNNDRTEVAVSPNINEVHIHKREGDRFVRNDVLTQHELRVTSIDWAPKTDRMVTCSADRNAYVWFKVDGVWKPTLVLLRINRAATCVKWSPSENKFAVGCGARLVSICYFDEENDWWLSKHIKKPIRSTVTCIDWHPNSILIACGSTDFMTRVFSAYIKEVEKRPEPTAWGAKMPLGNLMAEYSNSGWVHNVSFSPDGSKLAWVCHNSTLTVVLAGEKKSCNIAYTPYLPFLTCTWVSEKGIIVAGYNCCPMLYFVGQNGNKFLTKLDKSEKKEADGFSAMRKFRDMDKRAMVEDSNSTDTLLDTIHQNAITNLSIYKGSKEHATKICTTGMDGKLVIWSLDSVEKLLDNVEDDTVRNKPLIR